MFGKSKIKIAPDPLEDIVRLPAEWPYRLAGSLVVLGVILVLASLTATVKQSLVSKQFDEWAQEFYAFSGKHGFGVDEVLVFGHEKTSAEALRQAVGLSRDDNIFQVNVAEIKERVETLPWVKSAVVKKSFMPNVVQIGIVEKQVKSIWQISEKFHPIDEDGKVIHADFKPDKPILLIVGAGAPENINALLNIIQKDNAVFKRVKVANYISQRRWNLVLDDIRNGITVKLPEEGVEKAWKKLLKLNMTKGILKRKLTIIDLRLKDKVVIKLKKTSLKEPLKLNNGKERAT
ncbi:MAG: FtsQ-type POTRA domain-containing protein [Alphaproteobacteria bacterium]|nr:FtsQ-type POTRA domain-containing protein [Alphaproteobacteria bacterium]